MKASKKTATKKASTKKAAAKAPASKTPTVRRADPVVHFEMPAGDSKRMAKFYTSAFGWKTQMLGKDMGNYVTAATTTEVTKNGTPKKGGIINGGFYLKTDDMPAQYPSIVISVDNIKKSIQKITKAGGQVLGEPMDIPGIGAYVAFVDTEGNRISILQPPADMKGK